MDAYAREREILMHRAMPDTHVRNLIWQNATCGTFLCFHLKKTFSLQQQKSMASSAKRRKVETVKELDYEHFTAVECFFFISGIKCISHGQKHKDKWLSGLSVDSLADVLLFRLALCQTD